MTFLMDTRLLLNGTVLVKKFTVSLSSTQRLGCLANNCKWSCYLSAGIIYQYSLCVREREAERGLGVAVLEQPGLKFCPVLVFYISMHCLE